MENKEAIKFFLVRLKTLEVAAKAMIENETFTPEDPVHPLIADIRDRSEVWSTILEGKLKTNE